MALNNNQKINLSKITSKQNDVTKWYTELVFYAKLAKYAPVKGTIFITPNGYFIWEQIQIAANKIFNALGIENVYFPSLIPLSLIEKEKAHVSGFAPELVTISQVGNKNISAMTIRPTSETLFCEYFKDEIQSYKDLPIMLNQWCNVIRWEKNTRPFLRNSEFLWQEGHTAFATATDANNFTLTIIKQMRDFFASELGIFGILGKKTDPEKFAGANNTYTIEVILDNGYCLQLCTSHYLGTNFSKNFDIKFLNINNEKNYIEQNSFGFSTRLIAALIMVHGDDYGLVLPPMLAKIQINILLLQTKSSDNQAILATANKIKNLFENEFRVSIDLSDKPLGFKCIQAETQGCPVYIEIGPKDLEHNIFNVYQRHIRYKSKISFENLYEFISNYLKTLQKDLFIISKQKANLKISLAYSKKEIIDAIKNEKVALAPFSLDTKIEEEFKKETSITIRCIDLEKEVTTEMCALNPETNAMKWVYFAKAY